MKANLILVLASAGTLLGLTSAQIGDETATADVNVLLEAYAAVDKTKKPTVDDWVNALAKLSEDIVNTIPKTDKTDEILKLIEDAKAAIIAGDHGQGAKVIGDVIKLYMDIRALVREIKDGSGIDNGKPVVDTEAETEVVPPVQ